MDAQTKAPVSTQWVADHLDDPNVRIVVVIWGSQQPYGLPAYTAGHIPGAVAWDYETDYGEAQGDVIDKERFEQQLSRSGITSEMTVILYSSVNNLLATFEFWLMKYYGHADVRLLDGDRDKWLVENRPLESNLPNYPPTQYKAKEPDESLRASRPDVLQAIGQGGVLMVDARSAEMYSGESHPDTENGGHIPGAINLAAQREVDADGLFKAWRVPTVRPDGTFKSPQELKTLFEDLEITPDKEIITYCLRGGLSTHAWFVLTQLLGYPHVREYDRSWAEWGNLPGAPFVTGNSPMPANDWNIPGNWVEIYHNIFIPAMIGEWVPRVLALVDLQPGENVLDVACGTGALTRAIAEAVGQNGSVTGVDISPDILSLAREHTHGKYPAIEWRECDAQSLPFEDAVFDVAFCQLGLMFMPDKVAALKEMLRVIKPGGRVAVMVWGAIDRCPGQAAMAKTWEELYGAEQSAGFHRQHSLSDPENLRSLFVAAGFQEIEVNLTMGTMCFPSAEHLVRSYGALGQFPADERVRIAAISAVTQALQSYVGSESLVYPIEAVLTKANVSVRKPKH